MFNHHWSACLALILGVANAAPSVVVTFDNLGARVRSQNPSLAAARLRIAEAYGRMRTAGRLENPRLETSVQHTPSFREGSIELGISQKFPVTNRLRLEKQLSLAEIRAAELEVRREEQKLIAEARAALVEILAIRQRRGLLRKQADLTNQLAANIDTAARKGEGSLLDAGQARLEATQTSTESLELDAREAMSTGLIKPLLGIGHREGLVISGTLADPRSIATATNPARRADYQIALLETDATEQSIAIEKSKRREDWEAAAFVSGERMEDAPDGLENEAMVGVRLSIPLPFWNNNEGNISEATARHERKRGEAAAMAANIRGEAAAAIAAMRGWIKLMDEIDRNLLPLAGKQAADTEAAWRNGQAEFQTVLKSRAQRLQLEITRQNALREFHLTRVRYLAAIGTP
ncbi:MAG: TolC family protein [Verrucomicrobiota bacterium]